MSDIRVEVRQAVAEASDWLWGMLQGDFNDNQTTSQALVGGLISIIPGVDQLFDVRDLIANIRKVSEDIEETEAWIALVLTLIGLIPVIGSILKTAIKVARKTKKLDEVLAVLRAAGYGDPVNYLRTLDWDGLARKAMARFNEATRKIQHVLRDVRHGRLSKRLLPDEMLARLERVEKDILALQQEGARMIPQAMQNLRREIDDLFKQDYQASIERAARTNQTRQVVKNSERPLLRLEYETAVMALKRDEQALRAAGKSEKEIADILSERRRDIGEKYKNLTDPELRQVIYERNQGRGNDPTKDNKLGLTTDELRKGKFTPDGRVIRKPKTDQEIIASAQRPDGGDLPWDLILERQLALDKGEIEKAKALLEEIRLEMRKANASNKH